MKIIRESQLRFLKKHKQEIALCVIAVLVITSAYSIVDLFTATPTSRMVKEIKEFYRNEGTPTVNVSHIVQKVIRVGSDAEEEIEKLRQANFRITRGTVRKIDFKYPADEAVIANKYYNFIPLLIRDITIILYVTDNKIDVVEGYVYLETL